MPRTTIFTIFLLDIFSENNPRNNLGNYISWKTYFLSKTILEKWDSKKDEKENRRHNKCQAREVKSFN